MAKKVVASFKKDKEKAISMTKIIHAVKNERGHYSFKATVVPSDKVADTLDSYKTGK